MSTGNQPMSIDPDENLQPAIELPQSPEDGERVLHLVSRYGIRREDDAPEEAALRLASMALLLANIAAGHARGRADGYDLQLGVDFVVEGGFAAGDFVSSAISPLAWIQDRWERNLLHDVARDVPGRADALVGEKKEQDLADSLSLPAPLARRVFMLSQANYLQISKRMDPASGDPYAFGADPGQGRQANGQLRPQDHMLMPKDLISTPLTSWRRRTMGREALEYPVIFSGTVVPAGLQSRAARAHLGHLLVHSRIDSVGTLDNLWKSLSQFAERGTYGRVDGLARIRANLALCAGTGLLDEALVNGKIGLRNITRLLWLVESAPGCELPGTVEWKSDTHVLDFSAGCENEIRRRINFSDDHFHDLEELKGMMAGWRSFLRERERHLPDIASTVLNLPAALSYGLKALCRTSAPVDGEEVISLAKWLVLRMANRIAVTSATVHDTRTERLAAKLADKLSTDGPMKVRDLTRKCSRLTARDCRTALEWLAEQKIAAEQNGIWGILAEFQIARAASTGN